MPLYTFTADDGSTIEEHFSMTGAPPIGTTIEREGKTYTRVVDAQIDVAGIERKTHKYPFKAYPLRRRAAGAKHTKTGIPIITSQRHEREMLARHGFVRE